MSARKGWEGAIRVATTQAGLAAAADVEHVESVDVDYAGGLEAVYELGSRLPKEVKEGNITIGLTITKKWVDNVFAGYAGVGGSGAVTEYYVGIYPEGYATGNREIVLFGKFSEWHPSMSQDGYAVETLNFVGKTISIGTI